MTGRRTTGRRTTTWAEGQAAFAAAARWFAATVATIDTEWERPALGDWTVRDLVGHTSRALLTVEAYLGPDAGPGAGPDAGLDAGATVASPAAYYGLAMASLGEPSAVAARGHDAGLALGPDPAGMVEIIARRVLAQVAAADPEARVETPVGGMRLADYLPTRTFELTVHTCDLAAALGVPAAALGVPAAALGVPVSVPDAAASACLRLLADLAVEKGLAATLLLAATGRGPLPAGFTVL
ncbi:maleylpyruvate isomerase N-terminal domain-containing protein [Cryobacterium fucosi]|uniref:Mycothiol-dependent maleylpyruvate isomerase metal-binding domain-containing protein n=1 Tax=Cryobacterium fucosi TaxID=1259157 RepID=A0A4R9AWE1_9MICO|nr:maleylpyruvate isomerase N-terminal domain-containing protein [Cryobacterium fucosi]TFD70978.1 hypothetical protein E3T48_16110 [Cryobacterium fucosi]